MDINNTPEPRMLRIENLELLDLMGVIPSPSYDSVQRQSAIGSMPPAAYPSSNDPQCNGAAHHGCVGRLRAPPHLPHPARHAQMTLGLNSSRMRLRAQVTIRSRRVEPLLGSPTARYHDASRRLSGRIRSGTLAGVCDWAFLGVANEWLHAYQ
jgi:hypothetical protein